MKNYCIIPLLIFLLFMLVYQCSAQDYIVSVKRDTIRGQVKPLTFGPDKKVQVVTADKQKTTLPITQTMAFSWKGDTYHPVKTENGYVFMKLIKEGYLSLYAFQFENQMNYEGRYLVKKDGAKIEVPNLSFKKVVSKFLTDCDEVSTRIDNGEMGKKEMFQIIDEYNRCIGGRTSETKKVIDRAETVTKKRGPWDALEEKLKAEPEFEGKKDALEMVAEIKSKISRSEKVPNFLLDGLKSALEQTSLKPDLDTAIKDIGY